MHGWVSVALAGLVWGAWIPWSEARMVYVCERLDGTITVTNFPTDDPATRAAAITRTREKAPTLLPPPARCWETEQATLPDRDKPDPREPGTRLTQRHQWRRGVGETVTLDPTIKRPHGKAFQREMGKMFSPARRRALDRDPMWDRVQRAVKEQEWPRVTTLLAEIEAQGTLLAAAELAELRAVGRAYDIDLGP